MPLEKRVEQIAMDIKSKKKMKVVPNKHVFSGENILLETFIRNRILWWTLTFNFM